MNGKWATYERGRTRNRRADVLVALAASVVVVLVLATTSYAAKPTVAPPSIALAGVNTLAAAGESVSVRLGDWVTFITSYPTNVKNPRIEVLCYQDAKLVFGMAGGVDYSFQLGGAGSTWLTSGGAADCTANLFYFGWKAGRQTYNWLADTKFQAEG